MTRARRSSGRGPKAPAVLLVGGKGVARALSMGECIGAMEDLYRGGSQEIEEQPPRTITRVDPRSLILTMPSYSPRLRRFAVKLVTEFKENPAKLGIPAQGGIITLLDGASARVLALIDSAALTAVRTGAVSGLATRLLSRRDSATVGVIGSGEQARTQLQGVCEVRRIKEARVFSPNPLHAKHFSTELGASLGIDVKPCRSSHQACDGADIIIAATNSAVPVLKGEDIPRGCHINSIGTLPERVELAPEVVARSSVYVDTLDGVLKEAGDIIHAIKSGLYSSQRVVSDLARLMRDPGLGRKTAEEITLFKSVGFGLQDVYACSRLYDNIASDTKRFYPDVQALKFPASKLRQPTS